MTISQDKSLKFASTIQLHMRADFRPVINLAKNDISFGAKLMAAILLLYQMHSQYDEIIIGLTNSKVRYQKLGVYQSIRQGRSVKLKKYGFNLQFITRIASSLTHRPQSVALNGIRSYIYK